MNREELERAIAERLVRAYLGDDPWDADVTEQLTNTEWFGVAREAMAMMERVVAKAIEVENNRVTGEPHASVDLSPALEKP